jgi:hypothetical protein
MIHDGGRRAKLTTLKVCLVIRALHERAYDSSLQGTECIAVEFCEPRTEFLDCLLDIGQCEILSMEQITKKRFHRGSNDSVRDNSTGSYTRHNSNDLVEYFLDGIVDILELRFQLFLELLPYRYRCVGHGFHCLFVPISVSPTFGRMVTKVGTEGFVRHRVPLEQLTSVSAN